MAPINLLNTELPQSFKLLLKKKGGAISVRCNKVNCSKMRFACIYKRHSTSFLRERQTTTIREYFLPIGLSKYLITHSVGKNVGKQVPSYTVAMSISLCNFCGGAYDWICQNCKHRDHSIQQFHSRSLFYHNTYICVLIIYIQHCPLKYCYGKML